MIATENKQRGENNCKVGGGGGGGLGVLCSACHAHDEMVDFYHMLVLLECFNLIAEEGKTLKRFYRTKYY